MGHNAPLAPRLPSVAIRPTVEDQEVSERGPALPREDLHEVLFHLLRSRFPGEAHATRETFHMGVHHHTLIYSEGVAQNHIGRLSTNSGKLREFGDAPR